MISVLIPVYNYNIVPLVKVLHRQLTEQNIEFEIIGYDDASKPNYVESNSHINKLPFTSLITSRTNNGRIKTRQLLCDKAQYNWLMFLDADVMPVQDSFIYNYLNALNQNAEAIFGGVCYEKKQPQDKFMLRWKYGIKHEEITAKQRSKRPYKHIVSANMLLDKTVFNSINAQIHFNGYGLDNYFGLKLKERRIPIKHIDNPVFHLGIEESAVYLKKKEEAVATLLRLIKDNKITTHDNSLLSFFKLSKRLKMNYVFSFIYKTFNSKMRNNLLSHNPSIKIVQLYKISYMCYKDLNS